MGDVPDTLARSTGAVAVATAVSRVTGFARTLALAAALGAAAVGDAYNGANSLPNMVYEMLIGGVMASILVPVLVRSRIRGCDNSVVFTQRLVLAATLVSAFVTVVAVLGAPLFVAVLVADSEQQRLATALAYLLLPEVFFYALAATATAVLNTRGSFAPAAWAPVLNNVVVIATVGVFVSLPGPVRLTPSSMTTSQVLVLGLGTTAGIVVQAAWTIAALRRTGFRWSWRVRPLPYTARPVRAGARLVAWIGLYVAVSQVGVAFVLRVAFEHGGVSTYIYADLLFQVPYGVLGVSLLTVLMPRVASAVAVGDRAALIADMGRAARYSVVALVPASVAMMLLGPSLTTVVFVGRVDVDAARLIGTALALGAFGLAPFALVMLHMRVFYAGNDMRTPALINIVMVSTKTAVVAVCAATLPSATVIVTLPAAGSLSYVVGAVCGHLVLRRRYGLLGFRTVRVTLSRVWWASVIAGGFCVAAVAGAEALFDGPRQAAGAALAIAVAVGTPVFLLSARVIGIPEVARARSLIGG